jgi:hypothetical protein
MARGTSTLKKAPMARGSGIKRAAKTTKAPAVKSTLKTRQRAVSAEDKVLWSKLAALGCIACMKDGHYNTHVSIHHVHGRTVPGCHQQVLPLCGPHHQDDGSGAIAVHPWKARFEARYGTQERLMAECMEMIGVKL